LRSGCIHFRKLTLRQGRRRLTACNKLNISSPIREFRSHWATKAFHTRVLGKG
jgi:hypothetical protein